MIEKYQATIGLEIHAELKTGSKMFCACRNDADERTPNVHICPICMAHPGSLPSINREAVWKVLRVGAALGGEINGADSFFDRKNYFYPDIPKGYQISQYEHPLVSGGMLAGVEIERVHLEEDTARSSHEGGQSLVDFNRAGVPLMELVTKPVLHDGALAAAFARELQLLLRYLNAGDANMEKGEMRVEANISVSRDASFGTKTEVKNLNSFRSVERAIFYEIERQTTLLRSGQQVVQETRGWNENTQETFSQRKKESSHDYRYFPEPDLPHLGLSRLPEFSKRAIRESLPELPGERRERLLALGLKREDTELFVRSKTLGDFFDSVVACDISVALLAANYIGSDVAGKLESSTTLLLPWLAEAAVAPRFARLMALIKNDTLSSRGAKEVLSHMYTESDEPEALARKYDLLQQSDDAFLKEIAHRVIAAHEGVAEEYRAGKAAALQFLVGQGMKETKGSANPAALQKAFETLLK